MTTYAFSAMPDPLASDAGQTDGGYDPRIDRLVAISGEPASELRAQIAKILEKPFPDAKAAPAPKGRVPRRPETMGRRELRS